MKTQSAAALVSSVAACILLLLACAMPAKAQPCGGQWLPGDGLTELDSRVVVTTTWDPDGAGPQPATLVAGGIFTTAGGVTVNRIARWTGSAWSPLGTGVNDFVNSLAVLPNGDLVAGGYFTNVGSRIARWNGTAWSPLGSGLTGGAGGGVLALVVLPNGNLIAGGQFTHAGGVRVNGIARWNGTVWSPLGTGVSGSSLSPRVNALAVLPNGDLIAGGEFTTAGGVSANSIARWNGTAWSPLGTGVGGFGFTVNSLAVLPNGDLIAGGNFTTGGGVSANSIARWNGNSWSPLGSGMNPGAPVYEMAVLPNGDLIAGGAFSTAGGVSASRIARWNGTVWSPLGTGVTNDVTALSVMPNGDLIAGGDFTTAGGVSASRIARWNGTAWSSLSTALNAAVSSLLMLPSGDVIAGGSFSMASGVSANQIARWNGTSWAPLASDMNGSVFALALLPSGDLVAGGSFTVAGEVNANRIARWNGTDWSPVGTGMNGPVFALAVLPNGEIIAGGDFTIAGGVAANDIARWNGTDWTPMGTGFFSGGTTSSVSALAVLPNGDIIAGANWTSSGGASASRISRWSGTTWLQLGTGVGGTSVISVSSLAVLPNGDLVAGGSFTTAGGVSANRIARWNGAAWSPLGTGMNGSVFELAVRPDGELIAGGNFTTAGGVNANRIARWNGTTWSPVGTSVAGTSSPSVNALAALPNGDLVAGGEFTTAGPHPSAYFARWTETNIPVIAHQPQPQALAAGQTLTLTSTPANGYANVSVQWRRNGAPITSGPGGASPGGGTVLGASGPLASPTLLSTATLTITNAQSSDSGDYTAVFMNACGEVASTIATVAVTPPPNPCDYDFNQDENVDLLDAQQMAQVFVGLITPEPTWLDGDLNGDENADLTDAQLLAAFVVTGTCGV